MIYIKINSPYREIVLYHFNKGYLGELGVGDIDNPPPLLGLYTINIMPTLRELR